MRCTSLGTNLVLRASSDTPIAGRLLNSPRTRHTFVIVAAGFTAHTLSNSEVQSPCW